MTAYLEQQIEEIIRAAVQTAVGSSVSVIGWRQPSLAGTVKAASLTRILVKILPRSNLGFGSSIVNFDAQVHVQVTAHDSPDGDLLTDLEGKTIALLEAWNRTPETMQAALSIENVFSADGFIFTQGGDCDFDQSTLLWYSSIPIQIKGHILA
jgi:hypothetical protein